MRSSDIPSARAVPGHAAASAGRGGPRCGWERDIGTGWSSSCTRSAWRPRGRTGPGRQPSGARAVDDHRSWQGSPPSWPRSTKSGRCRRSSRERGCAGGPLARPVVGPSTKVRAVGNGHGRCVGITGGHRQFPGCSKIRVLVRSWVVFSVQSANVVHWWRGSPRGLGSLPRHPLGRGGRAAPGGRTGGVGSSWSSWLRSLTVVDAALPPEVADPRHRTGRPGDDARLSTSGSFVAGAPPVLHVSRDERTLRRPARLPRET